MGGEGASGLIERLFQWLDGSPTVIQLAAGVGGGSVIALYLVGLADEKLVGDGGAAARDQQIQMSLDEMKAQMQEVIEALSDMEKHTQRKV